MKLSLDAKIEGLLFYKGEPMTIKKIAEILHVSEGEINDSLKTLSQNLENRGLTLIFKDVSVTIGTNPLLSELLEGLRKEELQKELSKAALETLAIILYKDGAARSEIDYVRGVNSSFILRNLLIRGLIEKKNDEHDTRRAIYFPTFETLSYMGISSVSELPEQTSLKKVLAEEQRNSEVANQEI